MADENAARTATHADAELILKLYDLRLRDIVIN